MTCNMYTYELHTLQLRVSARVLTEETTHMYTYDMYVYSTWHIDTDCMLPFAFHRVFLPVDLES